MSFFWVAVMGVVSAGVISLLHSIFLGQIYIKEILFALLIVMATTLFEEIFVFQSNQKNYQDLLISSLKWIIAKLGFLVCLFAYLVFQKKVHVTSFTIAFLVSYLNFMIYSVFRLQCKTQTPIKSHE
jgi:hypothetical protein